MGDQLGKTMRTIGWAMLLAAFLVVLGHLSVLIREATGTLRESRAVIGEAHHTLELLRKSAVAQAGYIEATTRRSSDIAQRTQLAIKHLDELIVAGAEAMKETKGTLTAANGTITQTNAVIEQIRKDSARVINAAESAGENAAYAGRQVGFLALTANAAVANLNGGGTVAIGELIAATGELREGIAQAQAAARQVEARLADPRVDAGLNALAAMPALVSESTEGVRLARKQIDTGAPGPVRKLINWLF